MRLLVVLLTAWAVLVLAVFLFEHTNTVTKYIANASDTLWNVAVSINSTSSVKYVVLRPPWRSTADATASAVVQVLIIVLIASIAMYIMYKGVR